MKIDEIKALWEKDSTIMEDDLANESLKIPKLHSKYYNIYISEKLILRKMESDHKLLKRLKYEYYLGRLSIEQIKELGWDQFELKILRSELDTYIDSDSNIIESLLKIGTQHEKVLFIENIIKCINGRGFHIKGAIDFLKWTNGA